MFRYRNGTATQTGVVQRVFITPLETNLSLEQVVQEDDVVSVASEASVDM